MSSETKVIIGMMAFIVLVVGLIILFDKNTNQTGGLGIGGDAPDFAVQDYSGKMIARSDYKDKNILLYFNEGVGCPPCWQQAATLEAEKEKFSALNTEILTIVIDPSEAIKTYIESYKISLPVL